MRGGHMPLPLGVLNYCNYFHNCVTIWITYVSWQIQIILAKSKLSQRTAEHFESTPCVWLIIARSALYVRAHSQNWNVRSFVRSSVRSSVRSYGFLAIFAKRIWGVDTCRCPSVFWIMNLKGFENFWKKVLEVYISMGFALKKNPVLDRFWWTFLKLFEKGVCGVDCVTRKKLENWRVWAAMLRADFMICLGEPSASRPCRARCI